MGTGASFHRVPGPFSDALANALQPRVRRLISGEPSLGERLDVAALDTVGRRLYERTFSKATLASRDDVRALLEEVAEGFSAPFSLRFIQSEWEQVVDTWQLKSWEAYRDVSRLGRKTRLPEK